MYSFCRIAARRVHAPRFVMFTWVSIATSLIAGAVACDSSSDAGGETAALENDGGDVSPSKDASSAEDASSLTDARTPPAPDANHGALAIAVGIEHTCALLDDHSVKCWGDNERGKLGVGDTTNRGDKPKQMGDALPAVNLGSGRTALSIFAGEHHTCAILDDHSLKCWGHNYGTGGVLGIGDFTDRGAKPNEMGDALPAVNLGTGRTALDIAAGYRHTCAILDDHSLKCWGKNIAGQLGLNDGKDRGDLLAHMGDALPAVDLGSGRSALSISAGFAHTCAILDDHSLKCWGSNGNGQLGLGDTTTRGNKLNQMGNALPVVNLGSGRTALAVATGDMHTCAILDDHSVKCWGDPSNGALGIPGDTIRGNEPDQMGDALPAVNFGAGRTALAISTKRQFTCALLDDHSVKCWGNGLDGTGHLVPYGLDDARRAVDFGPGREAVGISVGAHACALLDKHSVKCWGGNGSGELGLGDIGTRGTDPNQMGDALPTIDLGTK